MSAPSRDCQHGRLARTCQICELTTQLADAQAQIAALRQELGSLFIRFGSPEGLHGVRQALADTAAASQAHDAGIIERCAKVADNVMLLNREMFREPGTGGSNMAASGAWHAAESIAAAIRALAPGKP